MEDILVTVMYLIVSAVVISPICLLIVLIIKEDVPAYRAYRAEKRARKQRGKRVSTDGY
ncbi:MAG: hypothetical protein OYG31_03000 [Candidatus Kaiserbacteria bacterium]|nr:hypothetical protein [Candidatus Kaiserbacteria bacterium]